MSKYTVGEKVKSFEQFATRFAAGNPFYWRHKFMAVGFIQNWQVRMIINAIKGGVLYEACKQ